MNCSKRLLPTLLAVLFFAFTVMCGGVAGAATLNVVGGISSRRIWMGFFH
tara:strand:- start:2080 stop:2229 length:150 start_codon:yes stop_codon:yes gene_type:complete